LHTHSMLEFDAIIGAHARRGSMTPKLGFPVFDADNHMYETRDALTKYLPEEFKGKVNYVEVDGRTKIMFNNKISEMIPNPTFARVARPGSAEDYFLGLNPDGKS